MRFYLSIPFCASGHPKQTVIPVFRSSMGQWCVKTVPKVPSVPVVPTFVRRKNAKMRRSWRGRAKKGGVDRRHDDGIRKKSLLFFLSSETLFSLVFSSKIKNLESFIPDFPGIRVLHVTAFCLFLFSHIIIPHSRGRYFHSPMGETEKPKQSPGFIDSNGDTRPPNCRI